MPASARLLPASAGAAASAASHAPRPAAAVGLRPGAAGASSAAASLRAVRAARAALSVKAAGAAAIAAGTPCIDDYARVVSDFKSGHVSLPVEVDYWVEPESVEGTIPADLEGTLFRNGPGLLEIGGKKLNQPFDGDGMLCRFSFRGGRAHFSNRFVRTKGYVAEQAAGRMLFKGAFTTGNPSGGWFYNPFDFDVKNVANTHVVHWGGKLLALWEGGLPHELDPATMETRGESTLGGVLPAGKGPFAAHYKVIDGRLVNFGAAAAGSDADVTFYEFDEAGACRERLALRLPGAGFAFFHDFVTPNYYALFQNPVKLDPVKLVTEYMLGRCSIAECLLYDPALPMVAHLIGRPGTRAAGQQRQFTLPPHFVFHHLNAFETEGGDAVIVDSVAWRSVNFSFSLDTLTPAYYRGGQRSELYRTTLDLRRGAARRQQLLQRCMEFPTVAPRAVGRQAAFAYAPAAAVDDAELWGPNQVLVKATLPPAADDASAAAAAAAPAPLRTELWWAGPRRFVQEPVFVPKRGGTAEDAGWLLALVYDAEARKSQLVILDAQRVADGPVATLRLRHLIPFGLHGSWSSEYLGPAAAARV